MEIIGDILRVINEGSTRPTQIMHGANLTWLPLMIYLEMLLRNQLLTRETNGTRSTYKVTARGSAVLSMYLRLKEETDFLELEMAAEHRLGDLSELPTRTGGRTTLSLLKSSLVAANFRVLDNVMVGSSGTEYTFPLIVEGLSKSKYGFVILNEVDESAVIRNFVKQLDAEVDLSIVYVKKVTDGARRIAALDSIPVLSASNLAGFGESLTFLDAFRSGRSLLLEVDPSENYERVIQDLVRREADNCDVSVLTWKGSRVFHVVPRSENVTVHVMTGVSGPTRAGKRGETVASPHAQTTVEELIENPSARNAGRGALLVFDSLSEIMVSLGDEEAQLLLKRALQTTNATGQRSLFILKRGFHDARTIGLVRSLLPNQLTYDGSGLKLSRGM